MSKTTDNDMSNYSMQQRLYLEEVKKNENLATEIEELRADYIAVYKEMCIRGKENDRHIEAKCVLSAEIERQHNCITNLCNTNDELHGEIERLKAELVESEYISSARMQDLRRTTKDKQTLRARVEELEASLHEQGSFTAEFARACAKAESERDELRTELAAANEKLAALQSPAPTIVKQTWQAIGTESVGPIKDKYFDPYTSNGTIRKDHYSDGTVTATLETIGEMK